MKISHNDAIVLESIVRKVHLCDRAGMGGYIDADHFETNAFDAALIAIAPIWKNLDFQMVEDFLYNWEYSLRKENEEADVDINQFIQELRELVNY